MRGRKSFTALLLTIFVLCTAYLVYDFTGTYLHEMKNARLKEAIREQNQEGNKSSEILGKYQAVYEDNNEFAGWLVVPGTKINYPIMKPAQDNHFYLTHGPDGEESKYGALFMDIDSNIKKPENHFIIYGHYFRDGSMFGDLQRYKEQSYYEENPTFQMDTLYEEATYEIIAVFESKVFNKDEDVFKYYKFTSIDNAQEFEEYIKNIKELALYDTGKTAEYGDGLVTLSTCDYWTENGRLAVVAKRI